MRTRQLPTTFKTRHLLDDWCWQRARAAAWDDLTEAADFNEIFRSAHV